VERPSGTAVDADSPYDGRSRVDVPAAPDWKYHEIHGDADDARDVELAGPGDVRVAFRVPNFLNPGDELGEVTRIVIRAWERKERAEGLGA
jgi:hypothetical protein